MFRSTFEVKKREGRKRQRYAVTRTHRVFDRTSDILTTFSRKCCPFVYYILFKAKGKEYKNLRRLFSLLIGFALGYLFKIMVIGRFAYDDRLQDLVTVFLVVWTGIVYAFSVQARVLCWLVLPFFMGRSGRSFLVALLVTVMIKGPVLNLVYNTKGAVGTAGCNLMVKMHIVKEKVILIFKPLMDVMMSLGKSSHEMRKIGAKHMTRFKPLMNHHEDKDGTVDKTREKWKKDKTSRDEGKRIDKKHDETQATHGKTQADVERKLMFACEDAFMSAQKQCFENQEGYAKGCDADCERNVPESKKSVTAMKAECVGLKDSVSKQCKDSDIGKSIGKNYDKFRNKTIEFNNKFAAQVQYKMNYPGMSINLTTISDIRTIIEEELNQRTEYIYVALKILGRFIIFIFILVIRAANGYHNQYRREIDFDNIYITAYFRHIDERRRSAKKMTLLPLKEGERKEILDVLNSKRTPEEKRTTCLAFFFIITLILSLSLIVYFDYLVASALVKFREISVIAFNQVGYHSLMFRVNGTGFVAEAMKKILEGCEGQHTLERDFDNVHCLPEPHVTETHVYRHMAYISLGLLFLIYTNSYFLRLRRVICGIFYPKREKKRVLHLYNERLIKRKNYLKYKTRKLQQFAQKAGFFETKQVTESLPKKACFGLGSIKAKCIVCEEPLDGPWASRYHQCLQCSLVYCQQCWKFTGFHCYGCRPTGADDDLDSSKEEEV